MAPLIALLTDFGLDDSYVGVMKGVILGINPEARLIDITHRIQPQNVQQAAFVLLNAYRYFPVDTIFLTIVDPGVGSKRRPIGVRAGSYYFIAPDNGLLTYALAELPPATVVELSNAAMRETAVSATFHGRDVFAPAAAHLSSGAPLLDFGQVIGDAVMLPKPKLQITESQIHGEVMHIDRFGNVITSIGPFNWVSSEQLTMYARPGVAEPVHLRASASSVTYADVSVIGIRRTYSEADRGQLVAIIASDRYLELAVNQGSAAERLGVSIGDPVTLQIEQG